MKLIAHGAPFMGIDVAGSTRYTYITKKFNCTCADDVF